MSIDPVDVIRRFEPVLLFHRDEKFFPSDAKRYVEHCALWRVQGSPRDSKARWGGTSPRTFPHSPMIAREKIAAASGEPGTFIGGTTGGVPFLDDSADEERFLDLAGWVGGDDVDTNTVNRYAELDQIAGLYGGGKPRLRDSRFWYHAEVFTGTRLAALVDARRQIDRDRFKKLPDPALVCYYLFFPGHLEPLAGCENEAGTRWASCAGEWACVAVLLKGDGSQANYQPAMIGLTSRNAGAVTFLGQERRVGMRVADWSLAPKMTRDRGPNRPAGEHPRVFVALGTHGLYLSGGPQPVPSFSPSDASADSCGEFEQVAAAAAAAAAAKADREDDEDLILAKFVAGAIVGALHGSVIGGLIGGFYGNLIEFGMAGLADLKPPSPSASTQTDQPPGPGEIGLVVHPRGVTPTDVPEGRRRIWPRLNPEDANDETTLTTTDGDRAYSLWVGTTAQPDSRPIWLPTDDSTTGGFRGRWGNRVVRDPFNRRVGMRFPEFWAMFLEGLGKP